MTNDLADLVKQRIESLRPKLLDLSKRNPLIATKLGSSSHVRVVDELPDILFYKINNGDEMCMASLPAIGDDPRDEQTRDFREALINARLTDERYLSEMDAVDRDADDYTDHARQIERSLKDRVRKVLGLPPRQSKRDIKLDAHAKLHGIAPSYELPKPDRSHADARHGDDRIQTLLLPNDLERKLNAIASRCQTWTQETGINVLHIAYGFLEWSDRDQTETAYSPLILCESKIEKRRTPQGVVFSISGAGVEPALNAVLSEKLKLDFGVELPAFTGASVEDYFAKVGELSPRNVMTWRVRRQVAIGVFPSARMAMYYDLDPNQPDFRQNEIVQSLLGGRHADSDSPYADEYDVDQPDVEGKVPFIVLDADSSQFSTLVDIAQGKNLAIEGPPGTGKSQTIVNAIAAALADGKKVLFVAEKLAALNVVKSRLEAIGLGEFLLPLQAERSTREQVIASVRERMEMKRGTAVRDFEDKLKEYRRTRRQLAKYIELLTRPFGGTGLTIREILGKTIATDAFLAGLAPEIAGKCNTPETFLTKSGLKELRQAGAIIEDAYRAVADSLSPWKETRLLHPERFTIEEACNLAGRASRAFSNAADAREGLAVVELAAEEGTALSQIDAHLKAAQAHVQAHGADLLISLLAGQNAAIAQLFLERCEEHQRDHDELAQVIAVRPDHDCIELIGDVAAICERLNLGTVDPEALSEELQQHREAANAVRSFLAVLAPLVSRRPESGAWQVGDIATARSLFEEAGDDAMLCRTAWTGQPDAIRRLPGLCAEGRRLKNQKSALADQVSFAIDVPLEELSECISAIRAAGTFSFFSSRYRNAKRLFLSIARAPKFDRPAAIEALEALICFRRQEAEFNRHSYVQAAFGVYFKGVDTEFERFERLAKFYLRVESHFGSPDRRSLRTFLREADLSELDLLRSIPPNEFTATHELLQERLNTDEIRSRNLEEAISVLSAYVYVFTDVKTVDPGGLRQLADRIRALIAEGHALDEHHEIRPVLGSVFRGSQTPWRELAGVVGWFSNQLVYDGNLIVFPSAAESASRMGVELRHVSGRYKAGTNPLEAKAVVEAALAFMRTDPGRSLGIVTLNQKQRDLISEEFEYALAGDPHAVKYIESWKKRHDGLEEFFIKNLENVQGDERDVIFIGTVYGPEEPGGRVTQRFGPINGLAGKRRLNVLFTRAKQKIVTFSSMTAADIVADETVNPGTYMLKRWLEYSASGVLEGGSRTDREPDSDFEIFVMNQIRSMGCEAVPQVGVAGYFIDIGVRHPNWPYGYVLGVECDGAAYHSAKSARDRDRLRQEVLEGLGWRLHRIWSTDWFNHPRRESEKLRAVIASRVNELKSCESEYVTPKPRQSGPQFYTPAPEPDEGDLTVADGNEPHAAASRAERRDEGDRRIGVGDTVRLKYLDGDRNIMQITISKTKSDSTQGIVNQQMPVAKALLGAEVGDEVEVLIGSYVRRAVVERIIKID
jgi:very-short-patch-repair endonuclease